MTKLLEKYDPRSIKESSPQPTGASRYQMKLQIELIRYLNHLNFSVQSRMIVLLSHLYRAPEVLFQPPMVGIDQCGLSQTLELVINSFPPDIQQRLVNVNRTLEQAYRPFSQLHMYTHALIITAIIIAHVDEGCTYI